VNKIIIALAATTALGAAMPAAAQGAGSNIQVRIGELQTELQAGVRSGGITRAEAMPLRQQLRQLNELERQYAQGGLSLQERSALQGRIATLRQGIRTAARTGDSRYDRDGRYDGDERYGRDDSEGRYDRDCPPGLDRKNNGCLPPGQVDRDGRDGRDGRWNDGRDDRGQWVDRNRDGYDDRDLNRDRRVDDREWRIAMEDRDGDRYDRGDDRYGDDRYGDDRYDDRSDRDDRAPGRGGLGGLIDNVLGGGGLRVGQRASGNLGAVPYEYRNQYRDGNGVYYRADARAIYQIDARTDTVVRIHSLNR
jgi:hypothetical protein